jgi:hypothetical protein
MFDEERIPIVSTWGLSLMRQVSDDLVEACSQVITRLLHRNRNLGRFI